MHPDCKMGTSLLLFYIDILFDNKIYKFMTSTFLSSTFHTYVTIYKYLHHLHIWLLSLYCLDMQGHALQKMSKTMQVNDADKTRQTTVSIESHHFVSSICRYMDLDFVQSLVGVS